MTALSAFAGSKGYAVPADAVFPPFLRKQKGAPAERRTDCSPSPQNRSGCFDADR